MARLVWVGVGAAGGIYVYRKGEQAADVVRQQGALGTLQMVMAATLNTIVSMRSEPQPAAVPAAPQTPGLRVGRFRVTRDEDAAPALPAPIVDTGVIDITDAARRPQPARRRARAARRKAD